MINLFELIKNHCLIANVHNVDSPRRQMLDRSLVRWLTDFGPRRLAAGALTLSLASCGSNHGLLPHHKDDTRQETSTDPDDPSSSDHNPNGSIIRPKKPEGAKDPPVPNLKPADRVLSKDDLMISAASISASSSTSNYDQCNSILRMDLKNRSNTQLSSSARQVFRSQACRLDTGKLADGYRNYRNNKNSQSSSTQTDIGFGYDLIDLDLSNKDQSASSSDVTVDESRQIVETWKKQACSSIDSMSAQAESHVLLSENVDQNAVNAWRACITQKQHGFFCSSKGAAGRAIDVQITWSPDPVLQSLLPKLKVSLNKNFNAKLEGNNQYSSLGTGSGISLTYTPVDSGQGMILNFNATDDHDRVNFSCSIMTLKPTPEFATVTNEGLCGSDEIKSQFPTGRYQQKTIHERHSSCGNETTTVTDGGACGFNLPEVYTKLTYAGDPECGAVLFQGRSGSNADHECGPGETKISHREGPQKSIPGSVTHDRRMGAIIHPKFCWEWEDHCQRQPTPKTCSKQTGQFNECDRTVDDSSRPIQEERVVGHKPKTCKVPYDLARARGLAPS